MYKKEIQFKEDPDTSSRLSMAILAAYGIMITVFLVLVGVIYGFSQMIGKLNL